MKPNKERILKIAKELGLKVSFDSDNPGVLNTTTGERKPLSTYFEGFMREPSVEWEVIQVTTDGKTTQQTYLGDSKDTLTNKSELLQVSTDGIITLQTLHGNDTDKPVDSSEVN